MIEDSITERLVRLRSTLADIRTCVGGVSMMGANLHVIEGRGLEVDLVQLGAQTAGAMSVIDAGLVTQIALLDSCIAGRAKVLEAEAQQREGSN